MNWKTRLNSIKVQVGKNWYEWYVLLLISLAIPAIVYMFAGIKLAVTGFVVIQIALGILKLRTS